MEATKYVYMPNLVLDPLAGFLYTILASEEDVGLSKITGRLIINL